MERKVYVTVTGTQRGEDGTVQRSVTSGEGRYCCDSVSGVHRVEYKEGENLRCTVILSEGELRVLRSGEITADMAFREGERTSCLYRTPHGSFLLNMETIKIGLRASENRIDALARYSLIFENNVAQENTILLRAEFL